MADVSTYTPPEELANRAIHALGIIASLIAMPWLYVAGRDSGDPWRLAGGVIFGLSALLMFTTSVLYHSATLPHVRRRLRRLDHCAIYVLIAGTYTPIALGVLKENWGWTLAIVVWCLALAGIVFKLTPLGFRFHRTSTLLYLGMGWLAVIAAKPIMEGLTRAEQGWLLAGGLCYTGGVAFYVLKSRRYAHAVWHVFVLAGVSCHFMAVLSMLSPRPMVP
jgi:hemolysin III